MRVSRHEGSYNWCKPEDKQALWEIHFQLGGEHHRISSTIPIGDDFDVEGETDPWSVADAIEGYQKRLWISTGREATLATIKLLRDNEHPLRIEWNKQRISEKEKLIERLQKEIKELQYEVEDLQEPAVTE